MAARKLICAGSWASRRSSSGTGWKRDLAAAKPSTRIFATTIAATSRSEAHPHGTRRERNRNQTGGREHAGGAATIAGGGLHGFAAPGFRKQRHFRHSQADPAQSHHAAAGAQGGRPLDHHLQTD